jgi:glycine cleavage system H protein
MNEEELKYTEEHLWVHVEGSNARFGITDHAQKELEEIVYVELPEKGKKVRKGDIVCTIESVKSTNDLSCPLSGEIHTINTQLRDEPEIINNDPYEAGWIFTVHMDNPKQVEALLDAAAYKRFLESQ